MATKVLPLWSAAAPLTVTLGGLANSTAGVGRQSTVVDNTTTRHQKIYLYPKIKLGTGPTANTLVTLYLVRDDGSGSPNRTDNAGASDAGITRLNAVPVGTLVTSPSATTGDVLQGDFVVDDPGPKWGLIVVNGTGVALDATNGSHVINWVGEEPEFQA